MKHDLISDALSIINNAEIVGKKECLVPESKFVKNVLDIIQASGYIGPVRKEKNGFVVSLLGKINKIRVVRPRFSIKSTEYGAWERKYLPSKDIGVLIISTSKGMMNQKQASEKNVGGKIVAYVY
jgi:small subunit ribosomal protein S8